MLDLHALTFLGMNVLRRVPLCPNPCSLRRSLGPRERQPDTQRFGEGRGTAFISGGGARNDATSGGCRRVVRRRSLVVHARGDGNQACKESNRMGNN